MKIVIEIPEEYRKIFETEKCKSKFDSLASNEFGYVLRKAFENGTPLPKGHGALIDRSEVINNLLDYKNGKKTLGECIEDIKIIIEANWEDEEE